MVLTSFVGRKNGAYSKLRLELEFLTYAWEKYFDKLYREQVETEELLGEVAFLAAAANDNKNFFKELGDKEINSFICSSIYLLCEAQISTPKEKKRSKDLNMPEVCICNITRVTKEVIQKLKTVNKGIGAIEAIRFRNCFLVKSKHLLNEIPTLKTIIFEWDNFCFNEKYKKLYDENIRNITKVFGSCENVFFGENDAPLKKVLINLVGSRLKRSVACESKIAKKNNHKKEKHFKDFYYCSEEFKMLPFENCKSSDKITKSSFKGNASSGNFRLGINV